MTIDPRMAARRRNVRESRAQIDLRRFLWLIAGVGLLAAIGWILTSPILSVRSIQIFGELNADTSQILAEQRVVDGRPLVAIRPGRVAEALEQSPWVRSASVELVFPDQVEINIDERVPVAWVSVGDRWVRLAGDGVLLEYGNRPVDGPVITMENGDPGLGAMLDSGSVAGAIEFIAALPARLASVTSVRDQAGELWATVGDREVRLGRPIEMSAKAGAVAALIDSSIVGVLDVIAPARPAIWAPLPPADSTVAAEAGADDQASAGQ